MILDHMGFSVRDTERSKAFYVQALAPLGIAIVMKGHGWVGMGREGRPQFWFGGGVGTPGSGPVHLAFAARSRGEGWPRRSPPGRRRAHALRRLRLGRSHASGRGLG